MLLSHFRDIDKYVGKTPKRCRIMVQRLNCQGKKQSKKRSVKSVGVTVMSGDSDGMVEVEEVECFDDEGNKNYTRCEILTMSQYCVATASLR